MNEIQNFIQTNTWVFPILICLAIAFIDLALYSYYGHLLEILTITGTIAGSYSFVYMLFLYALGIPQWTVITSASLFAVYFGMSIAYLSNKNKRISDWK